MDEWVATGRVVLFGVSGLLSYFLTQDQIQGIRRIPAVRLLLETSSPHLRVGTQEMTPGQIGLTNRRVAEIHQIDVRQLAVQVRINFAMLFGHQLLMAPLSRGNLSPIDHGLGWTHSTSDALMDRSLGR